MIIFKRKIINNKLNGALANYSKFAYYATVTLGKAETHTIDISSYDNGVYLLVATCSNAGYTSIFAICKKSYNKSLFTMMSNYITASVSDSIVTITNGTGFSSSFVFSLLKIQN